MAKILDIIPYKVLPAQTGGQKHSAIFCKYLGQQNELTTVSVKANDTTKAENYELLPIFSDSRLRYANPFYVSRIRKIILDRKIKNVMTEHPYMGWMGWWLRRRLKLKWLVHSHNIEHERFRSLGKWWSPLLKAYEKWVYRSADAVFFITAEDMDFAVKNAMIDPANAILAPFGTELEKMPGDRAAHRQKIFERHGIPSDSTLLFFNGALSYKPNTDALEFILDRINPLLLQQASFKYRILVCGMDLPARFEELKTYSDLNIIYAGFVDDVQPYFKAADIFLNPIITGGGIKTKVVEAMAYGATVISCKTGAAGINLPVCGEKIRIVPDDDEKAFVTAVLEAAIERSGTPQSYYDYYYWGQIVKRINGNFIN